VLLLVPEDPPLPLLPLDEEDPDAPPDEPEEPDDEVDDVDDALEDELLEESLDGVLDLPSPDDDSAFFAFFRASDG
jgi:hypothetical protein